MQICYSDIRNHEIPRDFADYPVLRKGVQKLMNQGIISLIDHKSDHKIRKVLLLFMVFVFSFQ